ncbi:MAG: hypothetical protein WA705_28305 [Candidatus Ozemobacteraceae bacterium]
METHLRFMNNPPACGSWNMAVDDVLFLGLRARLAAGLTGNGPGGWIRFYRWSPPTLSFGLFQRPERSLAIDRLEAAGIGAVRRTTGGKMVFHADEITFSMGLPVDVISRRSANDEGRAIPFLELFQAMMTPLVGGLRDLGFDATFASPVKEKASQGGTAKLHCYAVPAGHSIMLSGKKLVGAAGVLREGVLAIHGSLPLGVSYLPPEVFLRPEDAQCEVLTAVLGDQKTFDRASAGKSIDDLVSAITRRFALAFGLMPTPDKGLSSREVSAVEFLAKERYSDLFWPQKKKTSEIEEKAGTILFGPTIVESCRSSQ